MRHKQRKEIFKHRVTISIFVLVMFLFSASFALVNFTPGGKSSLNLFVPSKLKSAFISPEVTIPETETISSTNCANITMTLALPTTFQTFQRRPTQADIPIKGSINTKTGTFSVTFMGNPYNLTDIKNDGTTFSGVAQDLNEGQGPLVVVWKNGNCMRSVTVGYIGVGDVYLVAGQSNHTSLGQNIHTYSHPTLKATMLGNDYRWKELTDPFDANTNQIDMVSADPYMGGSYIPYLATKILAKSNVPVAFIPAALAGSSIEEWSRDETNHFNRETLYGSAVNRANQRGGVKAILWLQGESDVSLHTSTYEYKTRLIALANHFREDLKRPTPLVAYQIGQVRSRDITPIVTAIRRAADSSDNIILGPYLADIDLDSPPEAIGVHFVTDEQQKKVADKAFFILNKNFYTVE